MSINQRNTHFDRYRGRFVNGNVGFHLFHNDLVEKVKNGTVDRRSYVDVYVILSLLSLYNYRTATQFWRRLYRIYINNLKMINSKNNNNGS